MSTYNKESLASAALDLHQSCKYAQDNLEPDTNILQDGSSSDISSKIAVTHPAQRAIDRMVLVYGGQWPPRPQFDDWPLSWRAFQEIADDMAQACHDINNATEFREWMKDQLKKKVGPLYCVTYEGLLSVTPGIFVPQVSASGSLGECFRTTLAASMSVTLCHYLLYCHLKSDIILKQWGMFKGVHFILTACESTLTRCIMRQN